MDDTVKEDLTEVTILKTPLPTATSTVDRKTFLKQRFEPNLVDPSLSSINEMDLSRQRESFPRLSTQKPLGIPSMYLKPSMETPVRNDHEISQESTINESDLMRSTPDCSTPRHSLSQSIAALSKKITDSSFSLKSFTENFRKVLQENEFKPAEDAAKILMADEMEFKQQHLMPANENCSFAQNVNPEQMSIGDFFLKRSDDWTELGLETGNPPPAVPVSEPPNDLVLSLNSTRDSISSIGPENKSLTVSTIQKILSHYSTNEAMKILDKYSGSSKRTSTERASLPASSNSSYTSNHSENEALQQIANKENILKKSPEFQSSSASASSSRSSSRALTSLPEGKLPLESTASELNWGCVKLGKCSTQEFYVRNKSDKRVGVQMTINGHDFKMRKDTTAESDVMNSMKILLRAFESKVISVSFIPTKIGAAVDQLFFTPLDSTMGQSKKQYVKLFGYGGSDKIDFRNITKDTTGKYWLSLGKIDNSTSRMSQSFLVKNNGSLPSFLYVNVINKNTSSLQVIPNFFVLIPQEEKEITVDYSLSSTSYKMLLKHSNIAICEVASLIMYSGTEVNRGRLRRLARKLAEQGLSGSSIGNILIQKVNGEVMPDDVDKMKESTAAYDKIFQFFNQTEVVVTLEKDPDQTILAQPDETVFYQSLCDGETIIESTIVKPFHLEPEVIFLTRQKIEDVLFLSSKASKSVRFQIDCEPDGLEIRPREGQISQGGEITINLKLKRNSKCESFKIIVRVGGEVVESYVKVK